MGRTSPKRSMVLYLRDVPNRALWVACIAAYSGMISALWNFQVGPAVHELLSVQGEFERRLQHRGASDAARSQLAAIQEEVQVLRSEIDRTDGAGDRTAELNSCYTFIQSIAERSGLRVRMFDREGRDSISLAEDRGSEVILEGSFHDVMRFSHALAHAPSSLRLEAFVATASSELPPIISLSLTLSDVRREEKQPSLCEPRLK